jgi:hypothetical protein
MREYVCEQRKTGSKPVYAFLDVEGKNKHECMQAYVREVYFTYDVYTYICISERVHAYIHT